MGTKLRATLLATTLVGCTTVESTSVDASASPAKEQVKVESDARGEAFVLVGMVHEVTFVIQYLLDYWLNFLAYPS